MRCNVRFEYNLPILLVIMMSRDLMHLLPMTHASWERASKQMNKQDHKDSHICKLKWKSISFYQLLEIRDPPVLTGKIYEYNINKILFLGLPFWFLHTSLIRERYFTLARFMDRRGQGMNLFEQKRTMALCNEDTWRDNEKVFLQFWTKRYIDHHHFVLDPTQT